MLPGSIFATAGARAIPRGSRAGRRDELLRKSNKQAQDGWSKQQIEHRVKQLSNQYGSAVNALKLMIRTGGAPDERPAAAASRSARGLQGQLGYGLPRAECMVKDSYYTDQDVTGQPVGDSRWHSTRVLQKPREGTYIKRSSQPHLG